MNDAMHFCFITDDGYVAPTMTAIQSLIENGLEGERGVIHVVAADLSDENAAAFSRCGTATARVEVVRASAARLRNLHRSEGDMCVATPAALLKFSLGELLSDVDRVLYLDGDILVKRSLVPVFETTLGEKILAAAPDTGVLYCRRPIHDEVARYFNSGVMLLDLEKMRDGGYAEKLIAAKKTSPDHALMDQDVLNRVFDAKWLPLPPCCNCLLLNLLRAQAFGLWTMSDFNAAFGASYADLVAFDEDARIIHFSSKDKPWKYRDVPYAARWMETFGRTPLAGTEPARGLLSEDWPVRIPLGSASRELWWGTRSEAKVSTVGILCRSLGQGGLERALSTDVPMFVGMGLKVVVFTDLPVSERDYAIACDFKRVCLPVSDSDTVAHGAALRTALAREGVDVLLHHDAYIPDRLAADVRAALTLGIPVAIYWHSVFTHFLLRPGRQREFRSLYEACRGCRVVFTHTSTDECFFRMYGIPSVKNSLAVPDMMRDFRRKTWPRRLLWMGRLVELKRPIHALEIFRTVHEHFADAELFMLGDGDASIVRELRRWLAAHPACAGNVHLEGFKKDVRPYLESCGIGLVTSRFEGFCYSLIEMKMASLPVVSYEMPYLDTLKTGSGAICVPQEDIGAATRTIVSLFEDEAEWRRQGALARRSYEALADSGEETVYRKFFRHLDSGEVLDFTTIDPACAARVAETFVDHLHEALGIMEREVSAKWMRDRSYRLGRALTWPYRKIKAWVIGRRTR